MDTKWKSRKNAISTLFFVLGASLLLGGMAGIMKYKPGSVRLWQVNELFSGDYQNNYRFQDYITGWFWNFLTMAAGGSLKESWGYGMDGYWGSDYYGGWGDAPDTWDYDWEAWQDSMDEMVDIYEETEEEWDRLQNEGAWEEAKDALERMKAYEEEIRNLQEMIQSEMGAGRGYGLKEPTQEEKDKIAQEYHERIKGDKNLLYLISYEDQVLYANTDLLSGDGNMTAPKGYNFLLYFDGEKVRIIKDGKELDIYGDGYYREESSWQEAGERRNWYVPGYLNFPVDEGMKKVKIFLAAAKEPVLYLDGSYGTGGNGQYNNSLYWMNYYCQENREILKKEAVYFILGLVLLLSAFPGRKSRREMRAKIAGIQAKIWVEGKLLLMVGLLFFVFIIIKCSKQDYGLWQELGEIYYYEYGFTNLFIYGKEILKNAHPAAWIVLFWGIYLVFNDFKYNKKIWNSSLCGKLYSTFSVKSLSWPPARKMALRNSTLFVGATCYVLLLLGMIFWRIRGYGNNRLIFVLVVFGAAAFLLTAYFVGRKNMETAKDMEIISGYISEIRNGNYQGIEGKAVGHDLQKVMAELEDIRHGLEEAVEEQLKSQKMKVELIANVSHDIKTPLTSIISYVQFLKQEEELPEHVKDYVKILDEKSQRLKNMVQDVFAVSKAASGELPMHMEKLDFGKLLCQTMADMEEQIEGSQVSFRTDLPESPVMIMADGQRMYRVFQNLFQNAIQYSLAGSRVYVTLQTKGVMASASVKNASLMELDKEKDFAERFTRGDESRTDGGSGLGLAIAQSFTEACGGEFLWETDADLFVVKVSFRIAE